MTTVLHPGGLTVVFEPGETSATVGSAAHRIAPGDVLEYSVRPHRGASPKAETPARWQRDGYGATGIALDLDIRGADAAFSDLAIDQHGVRVTASAQGEARILRVDQWNRITVDLSAWAGADIAGLAIRAIASEERMEIDVAAVRVVERGPEPVDPVDFVVTTRGSNSTPHLSRGNTFPAVATPHGAVMATPVTTLSDPHWLYQHADDGSDLDSGSLEAFALTRMPSPWIGDHGTIHFFPAASADEALAARWQALGFSRRDERARPHEYAVRFHNGMGASLTAGPQHVAARFEYPGESGWVRVAVPGEASRLSSREVDGGLELFGHTDHQTSAQHASAPRTYFVIRFGQSAAVRRLGRSPDGPPQAVLEFADATAGAEMWIATSHISLHLARATAEAASATPVSRATAELARCWNETLGRVAIHGGTPDQRVTFYSSLYRMHLFPSWTSEDVSGRPRYASVFAPTPAEDSATSTGRVVRDGRMAANHGFWDTYRTVWPFFSLAARQTAGELLDAFTNQYVDGGWVARWSAPGYTDAMVGTSSDQVFADAVVAGVGVSDVMAAYDASLKNATTPSESGLHGRKGTSSALFLAYTPLEIDEGLSWTMENAISDYAIAEMTSYLLDENPAGRRAAELRDNLTYFRSRALWYRNLFHRGVGFFVGRDAAGSFRATDGEFDPLRWGGDYTETNAWGMAFGAPHDGPGLAALYGGERGLEAKLDEYFAVAEPASVDNSGSYGFVIHEMTEARDVRMGSWGVSNQPAHHVPFLYLFTGSPHKTQAITRDALQRLFAGSEIGQGYPGDEDNGEMSAWYVLCAVGLYPLALGSREYVITAPLFERVDIDLESGGTLTVTASPARAENVYIRAVTLNGEPWDSAFLPQETILHGAALHIELTSEPTSWGRGSWRTSRAAERLPSRPLCDVTRASMHASRDGSEHILIDDTSDTLWSTTSQGWVRLEIAQRASVSLYTLTAGADIASAPTSWTVEGTDDGVEWVLLDARVDEEFRWPRQTRPFSVESPGVYRIYRLTFLTPESISLAQVELLA